MAVIKKILAEIEAMKEAGRISSATKILKEGDIVSIDTGAIVDGWLVTTRDGMPSAHFEKTVAIMEDGPMVLTTEPMFRRPM